MIASAGARERWLIYTGGTHGGVNARDYELALRLLGEIIL